MRRGARGGIAAIALRSRKGAFNVVIGLTAIVAARLRCVGLALACARTHAVWLLHGTALLPRRSPGLFLGALLVAVGGGASGRRRGAASKANALSPLITVVVSVCHSYRLVSCITCLSYKKDVQQMGPRVKSSVNGTKGAKHTASKTSLYASDERTPVGRATTMSGKPCRSSQKRRHSYASSAFGRALSGSATPRPYLKATK